MTAIIGIGDNTVDLYVDKGLQFPGGNAVNVAVLAHRLGLAASYLGCIGSDARGRLMLDSLRAEGLDTSRCRLIDGANSWSRIRHEGNDRVFDGSNPGIRDNYNLDVSDDAYLARHDLAHSSIYSGLESELPRIRAATGRLSFDYSSEWSADYIAATAPAIDIAIASYPEVGEAECRRLASEIAGHGPQLVVITRGGLGALAYHQGRQYSQGIVAAEVVDTLGAGDGFIAGFLAHWLRSHDIPASLQQGAEMAAHCCTYQGGFGHGTALTSEEVAQLVPAPRKDRYEAMCLAAREGVAGQL